MLSHTDVAGPAIQIITSATRIERVWKECIHIYAIGSRISASFENNEFISVI